MDYSFDDVYQRRLLLRRILAGRRDEIAVRVAAGEFDAVHLPHAGRTGADVENVSSAARYNGAVNLTFGYDPTMLPAGFDETTLCLYQFTAAPGSKLASTVDPVSHKIAVSTTNLGAFALGVEAARHLTRSARAPRRPTAARSPARGNYAERRPA